MLKVKIELHKFGNPKDVLTLYEIDIVNDGTGTRELGNYRYTIFNCEEGKIVRKGKIKKYDRNKTALGLLRAIMKNSYPTVRGW